MEEAKAINKSLSALGDVLSALHDGSSAGGAVRHVPFRNSKLTHMLQPCLGGQAKVLMLVTLSVESEHVPETVCSLRFAEKVGAVAPGSILPSAAVKSRGEDLKAASKGAAKRRRSISAASK